jgi:hypothetical protein
VLTASIIRAMNQLLQNYTAQCPRSPSSSSQRTNGSGIGTRSRELSMNPKIWRQHTLLITPYQSSFLKLIISMLLYSGDTQQRWGQLRTVAVTATTSFLGTRVQNTDSPSGMALQSLVVTAIIQMAEGDKTNHGRSIKCIMLNTKLWRKYGAYR